MIRIYQYKNDLTHYEQYHLQTKDQILVTHMQTPHFNAHLDSMSNVRVKTGAICNQNSN